MYRIVTLPTEKAAHPQIVSNIRPATNANTKRYQETCQIHSFGSSHNSITLTKQKSHESLFKANWLLIVATCAAASSQEEEKSPVQLLRRNLQVAAKNVGQNNSGNLGFCEGDCNTNADCIGDLVCFQRDAGDPAPGCTLSDRLRSSRVDFCVARQSGIPTVPVATPVVAPIASPVSAPIPSGGTRARYVGNDNVFNLGVCEGDCDRDGDCAQGLKCYQRNSGEGAPGCILGQSMLKSDNDLCVHYTAPPTPVSSPVRAPTSGTAFALKLYWEQGYFWQEETIERKWCMSCRNSCSAGGEIAIFDCADSPTQWEFVSYGPNEVQMKVVGRDVCVELFPDNDLELAACNSSNQQQRFVASNGSFNDYRFEVTPKQRQGWCMTQRHHPKNNESVNIEPCTTARRSDTSYWNKY